MIFPQYQKAELVPSANYVITVLSDADSPVAIIAASGDVQIVEINSHVITDPVATITLPDVAVGGPVCVKLSSIAPSTYFGSLAQVNVVPAPEDVADAVLINGYGSISLRNIGDVAVFASDGAQWWTIGKSHNTHDTW